MKLGGPQATRERVWTEPELFGEREDLAIDRNAEKQVYEGELARVRRENSSLRDQLQRTLRELKAYQVKYPLEYIPDAENVENLAPWTTSSEIMTPLLEAYDARIREMEALTSHQKSQLENFHGQVEEILSENESMREMHLDHVRESSRNGGASDNFGPMGPVNMELMNELNERVEILMAENNVLVEQKALLTEELDTAIYDLEKMTEDMKGIQQEDARKSSDLSSLQQHLARAEADREEAAKQTMKISEIRNNLQVQLDEVSESLAQWTERCKSAEDTVSAQQKQLKSIIAKSEDDSYQSVLRIKSCEDRVKELNVQLMAKTSELDNAIDINRKLKREYHNTRQDAEGMLQVMSSLERQVVEFSSREQDVEKMLTESKIKVEEYLSAKELALAREEQAKREVERLYEERKRNLLLKHSEMESAIEQTRNIFIEQIKSLEHDIEQSSMRVARTEGELEKKSRDAKSIQESVDKLIRNFESEKKALEDVISKLESKVMSCVLERDTAQLQLREIQGMNSDLRMTIDKLRTQDETMKAMLDDREKYSNNDLESVKSSLRAVTRENAEHIKLLQRKAKEYNDLLSDREGMVSSIEKKRDEEVAMYRKRLTDMEHSFQEVELSMKAEEQRTRILIEQYKEKMHNMSSSCENRVFEMKEQVKRLSERLRAHEDTIFNLQNDKRERERSLQDAQVKISHLQERYTEAQVDISELTSQLAVSLESREKAARMTLQSVSGMDQQLFRNGNTEDLMNPTATPPQFDVTEEYEYEWQRNKF